MDKLGNPTLGMKNMIGMFTLVLIGSLLPVQGIADEIKPELDGYCPVAYFKAGKPLKGSKEFASVYHGKTYYLVNEQAKELFEKDPTKYLPQYDGYCAYGMTFGRKIPTDPTAFSIVDGKLYLNKNAKISEKFNHHQEKYIKAADAKWAKINHK